MPDQKLKLFTQGFCLPNNSILDKRIGIKKNRAATMPKMTPFSEKIIGIAFASTIGGLAGVKPASVAIFILLPSKNSLYSADAKNIER